MTQDSMPVVTPAHGAVTVTLAIGERLIVTGTGSVARAGAPGSVTIQPGPPVHLGAGNGPVQYVLSGSLEYEVRDPMSAQLKHTTRNIQSARVIAAAINKGTRYMGLHEKMAALADRMKTTPAALSGMADRLNTRLDDVAARGAKAETSMHTLLDDFEKGVAATEDALNQLTNGAPETGSVGNA